VTRQLERRVASDAIEDGPGDAVVGYAAFPRRWKSFAWSGSDLASRYVRR
jgi:hypothetical protein